MELALRPRSATEIVDAAFRLFRRHLRAFVVIGVLAAVPRLIIAGLQLATTAGLSTLDGAAARNPLAIFSGTYFLLLLASLAVTGIFESGFIRLADDALRREHPTAGEALSRGLARAGAVLGTFLIVALVTIVGLILLVVPGVYLGLRLYPAVPAAALEGVGPVEALSRAWRRTAGSVGRGFAVYAIMFLIFIVAAIAASIAGAVLGGLVGALGGVTGAIAGAAIVTVLVQALVGVLLYPLLAVATTLFYYDTRVRSEGLDLEMMADSFGPAPAGAGAAY